MPTLVVGLTGNVASGKSTVRRLLADRGASTLDADALVHDLYRAGEPGAIAVAEAFGPAVLAADGSVDRGALARATMGNPEATRRLESIIHPLVRDAIDRWIAAERLRGEGPALHLAVIEATLTFEAGTDGRHDRMVVVDAPLAIRRSRAAARGLAPDEFDRREGRLMPIAEKRGRATHVVENAGGEGDLRKAVDRLVESLRRELPTG